MLQSARRTKDLALGAQDGRIGHVEEYYFDDTHWTIRYLVAQAGNWLTGRMVLISPHTGYFGDYARTGKLGMFLRWHVMMPAVTRLMGYFPGRSFGLPEDLPYGIAMGWAKRRFARDTIEDAKDGLFSHIASTALIIRPEDDPFATMDAALRVQNHFPNTRFYDYLLRVPAGDHAIGHFGFFHPRNRQTAWTVALEWLAQAAPNAPMR